ncbi:MAG: hypothetical protein U5L72_11645 [Bacteroidales bacterium]|nr:hypothetical protein [Bacteroidales bacterium]
MELHELHVRQADAGAVGDREAVAGGDDRVRRVAIDLPASASRKHGRVGPDLDRLSQHARAHPGAPSLLDDQVEDARMFQHGRPLGGTHAVDEGAGDLGPRAIAVRMHDAACGVRGLAPELELAVLAQVEGRPRQLQLAHPRRPLLHQDLHRLPVAERRPGGQGVLAVQLGRIARAEGGGDPALGVRGRAVVQRTLGEDEDLAVRGGPPRRVQAGDAAADDEEAGAEEGRHEAMRGDDPRRTDRTIGAPALPPDAR